MAKEEIEPIIQKSLDKLKSSNCTELEKESILSCILFLKNINELPRDQIGIAAKYFFESVNKDLLCGKIDDGKILSKIIRESDMSDDVKFAFDTAVFSLEKLIIFNFPYPHRFAQNMLKLIELYLR